MSLHYWGLVCRNSYLLGMGAKVVLSSRYGTDLIEVQSIFCKSSVVVQMVIFLTPKNNV